MVISTLPVLALFERVTLQLRASRAPRGGCDTNRLEAVGEALALHRGQQP